MTLSVKIWMASLCRASGYCGLFVPDVVVLDDEFFTPPMNRASWFILRMTLFSTVMSELFQRFIAT
ncbi:hypothetical protein CNY89_25195, partial [Amaricoccus sp. HAR-UPW-R2A-40]